MTSPGHVERLAEWAISLGPTDVPAHVVELCRAQQRSVLAGVAASVEDAGAQRVLEGVSGSARDGPAPSFGRPRTSTVEDALYAAAALSIALDFDDYVCFGHTGHSSVLVPLLLAAETKSPPEEQLTAQVVANEVEARLGGACLIGPLNGQMWSFIHAAGTAVGAARLFGLDAKSAAHALAIALYQPPRPTVPGFMSPDSKLLTAAEPAVMGLRAARLAAAGVTGPLDALDHPHGFLDAFSYAPLPAVLGGLGEGWATETLCVKPYPGCAYIDTTIDALLSLGEVDADDVQSVHVDAGMLTCGMDALSRRYSKQAPTPVNVNFSIPWNVAITLVAGRLSPDEVNSKWLSDNNTQLRSIAERVTLRHDLSLTQRSIRRFVRILPPDLVRKQVGLRKLLPALRSLRAAHPRVRVDPRDAASLLRSFVPSRSRSGLRGGRTFWEPSALGEFAMTFPARVRVSLRGGRELVAEADVPRGGAGHADAPPTEIARAKLASWGPRLWGADGTAALDAAIESGSDRLPVVSSAS